jgi:hypothetical protein
MLPVVQGCGEFLREQGNAPGQVVITALLGASGAEPELLSGTVRSDVITIVRRDVGGQQVDVPTIFDDVGRVTMRLILKDPGRPGSTNVPSPINQITFTRYRVTYRRADGRNTPGVDVPFPFDSATTFTVPADGEIIQSFELVRHTAKEEAPLAALRTSAVIISTIAEIQFFGRDQAGNNVMSTASIGVFFGNFGDPT